MLVVWVAACGSHAPTATPPTTTMATPRAGELRGAPLVAAREDGLYELTADGRDVRRLSATPAQHPRWHVPGRRLVFLTRDAGELRALELDTAKERVIARVRSRLDCPSGFVSPDGPDPTVELRLHEDADFVVDARRACLRLMDRNSNMASYLVDIRIDLATGRTVDYLSIAPESCKLPRREAPAHCEGAALVTVARDLEPRDLEPAGPPGFTAFARSPSGRWVVLRGNPMEGDYIHSQVVLYEPATRRSFPVVGELAEKGGGWPAPLTAEQLALDAAQLGQIVGDVVGETSIYWLEGRDDRLVIDETLVIPGVRIVRVGQLAL